MKLLLENWRKYTADEPSVVPTREEMVNFLMNEPINPADNMGWDQIIVPSATKDDELLMPVGHVEYSKERRDKQGNDKIIIAPNKQYTEEDRAIIDGFFTNLEGFQPVRWY